jgi:hypothetical protein
MTPSRTHTDSKVTSSAYFYFIKIIESRLKIQLGALPGSCLEKLRKITLNFNYYTKSLDRDLYLDLLNGMHEIYPLNMKF